MAKKKVAVAKTAEAKPAGPGLGKKFCPNCNATIAARSTTCPECGVAIKPKKKGKARKAAAAVPAKASGTEIGNGYRGKSAAVFIREAGGIDAAIDLLKLVKVVVG